jgi:hypothetical protein
MSGKIGAIREDDPVANDAVVSDMRISKKQIVVADNRLPAAAFGTPVQSDKFSHDVTITQAQGGLLAVKFEILGRGADRGELKDLVVAANLRPTFDDGMRTDGSTRGDTHMLADHGKGPDLDVFVDSGSGMDYSG